MTKSQKKVIEAKAEVDRLRRLMCLEDGVGTANMFIVFNPKNTYTTEYNNAVNVFQVALLAERKNKARRDRHQAMKDLGLNRVVGALGGVYYE